MKLGSPSPIELHDDCKMHVVLFYEAIRRGTVVEWWQVSSHGPEGPSTGRRVPYLKQGFDATDG